MATTITTQPLTAAQEWRARWTLVVAAVFGFSFHSVMTAYSGLFIGPVGDEFGWSRTEITLGLSINSIIVTIMSPVAGMMLDRWGTRRIAIPGLLMKSLIFMGFGLMSNSMAHWLTMWVFYAFITLTVKSTTWTTAVTSVFDAGKGLALGVVMTGSAFAQIIVPPLGNILIEEFGWRGGFMWLGGIWGGVSLLLCLFFLFDVHDDVRKVKAAGNAPQEKVVLPGLTISEAWRSIALWRIAISTFIIMLFTIALLVHQIPILEEEGVSRTNAAWMASMAGVAGIFGKLITGRLLDKFDPQLVGSLTVGTAAVAFALFYVASGVVGIIIAAMLVNGYSSGAKLQISAYLTSRYAGARSFGTIYSIMASLIALGSGLGPVLGGIAYDVNGNYDVLLFAGIIGSAIAAVMLYGLGPYPDWSGRSAEEPAAQSA